MEKNEFRISEVPPGSVLLMGDVAAQRRRGRAARLTIQRADGRRAARPGEGSPQDLPRDGRRRSWARPRSVRTCCPKRVTCE